MLCMQSMPWLPLFRKKIFSAYCHCKISSHQAFNPVLSDERIQMNFLTLLSNKDTTSYFVHRSSCIFNRSRFKSFAVFIFVRKKFATVFERHFAAYSTGLQPVKSVRQKTYFCKEQSLRAYQRFRIAGYYYVTDFTDHIWRGSAKHWKSKTSFNIGRCCWRRNNS